MEYWGNVNCTGVRSCYDEGKRAAETLFFDYHRQVQYRVHTHPSCTHIPGLHTNLIPDLTHLQSKVDIRVARIFNTYGPGMHPYDGRVTSNFLVQV